MNIKAITFNGSIPQNYDDYLGEFLFEPYALDLVGRMDLSNINNILELACGTGRVTKHIIQQLNKSAKFIASDLNSDMISVATDKVSSPNITWATVDMSNIPYQDNLFDAIVCQFGVMFVPDKLKAFIDMHRVLNNGGKLLFNTWGNTSDNKVWSITNAVINSFIGNSPIPINQGPFSMHDENITLNLLKKAGFKNCKATSVNKIAHADNAASIAKGFILGLPFSNIIQQFDPTLLPKILEELEREFINQLGDQPIKSPLNALVFEAEK